MSIIIVIMNQNKHFHTCTIHTHTHKCIQLSLPIDVTTLPPECEDECIALQEEYHEEEQGNADLRRRKEELTSNILSQKTEIETLTDTISTLEAKVCIFYNRGDS